MKKYIDIICPVSGVKADENVARTAALLTVLFTMTALFINSYSLMLFLAADFAIRSFLSGKASPLKILSVQIAGLLKIKNIKLIDAAPKKFAALLGMIFSLLAGFFMIVQLPLAAVIAASLLIFCAFLEGVFGYCLGCVIYSVLTASGKKLS